MTCSWITCSLFWLLSWDKLPEMRVSQWAWVLWWFSICDAKLLSTRIVPISTGPGGWGCVWGCQFPLSLLCGLHTSTLDYSEAVIISPISWTRPHVCAFQRNPIDEADRSLRHLLCKMCPPLKTFLADVCYVRFLRQQTPLWITIIWPIIIWVTIKKAQFMRGLITQFLDINEIQEMSIAEKKSDMHQPFPFSLSVLPQHSPFQYGEINVQRGIFIVQSHTSN